MSNDYAEALPRSLRRALSPAWNIQVAGRNILVQHRDAGTPYRPPCRAPTWQGLLDRLGAAFAEDGVPRASVLPLRWGKETDLTISGVQALDPYLKHGQPYTYRSGYLPQPVVRLTSPRDRTGKLQDGYLTSFVNVSRVQPVTGLGEHTAILNEWIGVLSQLGLHARHVEIHGKLDTWERAHVAGITLRYRHAGRELGDLVLIWNRADPSHLVTDLGTGLERLRWTITRDPWAKVLYDDWPPFQDTAVLDALRTATLLVGCGIAPAARGPGSVVRRLMHQVATDAAALGLSRAVSAAYRFWALTAPLVASWPDVTQQLESELDSSRR